MLKSVQNGGTAVKVWKRTTESLAKRKVQSCGSIELWYNYNNNILIVKDYKINGYF